MEKQNIQRLIDVTCRQFATKFGNDLQMIHDTGCATFRRMLNSFAQAAQKELSRMPEESDVDIESNEIPKKKEAKAV